MPQTFDPVEPVAQNPKIPPAFCAGGDDRGMAYRFLPAKRNQLYLMPPSLRDCATAPRVSDGRPMSLRFRAPRPPALWPRDVGVCGPPAVQGDLVDQAASSYSWMTPPRMSRRTIFSPTVVVERGTGCSSCGPRWGRARL